MIRPFHLRERVRHAGHLAEVLRVSTTRAGHDLVRIRYLSGSWLGTETTVRPTDLDRENDPVTARPLSRSVA